MNKEQTQLIVLVSIVFIGAFAGIIFGLIAPSKATLQNIQGQIASVSKELKTNKGIIKKKSFFEKEIIDIKGKIETYNKNLITESEYNFFRDSLRDIGREYNVKVIRDYSTNIDENSKSVFKNDLKYSERQITLNLLASYHDLGSFLNRIEKTSNFRKVTTFSLRKRSSMDGNNKLTIQLSFLTLLVENPS